MLDTLQGSFHEAQEQLWLNARSNTAYGPYEIYTQDLWVYKLSTLTAALIGICLPKYITL